MSHDVAYAQKLAEFKSAEKPEVVLLLADDPDLVRIMVAWMNAAASPTKNTTRPPKDNDENLWWYWLWRNTNFSSFEVMEKASYFGHAFDRKFQTLVGNRILYPDATVNSFAQRYLREKVLKLFQIKTRPTPAKKE